jgi:hypothetical protein
MTRYQVDLLNRADFFFNQHECPDQLARTLTNPTSPEINDHVNL